MLWFGNIGKLQLLLINWIIAKGYFNSFFPLIGARLRLSSKEAYTLHSKTCVIRHLCNPFLCVVRRWFRFPFDHFLWALHCVIRYSVYSDTKCLSRACQIRQVSLYMLYWFVIQPLMSRDILFHIISKRWSKQHLSKAAKDLTVIDLHCMATLSRK